eukprot:m.140130 g.140130  ORF g.140130 m.140130 type:complete len:350 (-) comp13176_c0_seq37:2951-4000(-)
MTCVWVSTDVHIDFLLFDSWIAGDNVETATGKRKDFQRYRHHKRTIENDTQDQFNMFDLLVPYLNNPQTLSQQDLFFLNEIDCAEMLKRYYSYDNELMAHILGKQLSRGLRKDLDEVAEKTGIPLKSCNRQFDNLRRIFKMVEDVPGKLSSLISDMFLLDPLQAIAYASMVFITNNRLYVDKRVLQDVRLPILLESSTEFMNSWTSIAEPNGDDQDLHKKFLQDMREIKYTILHSTKQLQEMQKVVNANCKDFSQNKIKATVPILRSLIQIGGGLSNRGEWRDIFEDLMEQVVLPCKEANLRVEEVEVFIAAVRNSFPSLTLPHDVKRRTRASFRTFIETIGNVIILML